MTNYLADVERYKAFDPQGNKSVEDIAIQFDWTKQMSYTCKYFISELDPAELILLDKTTSSINLGVIAAVCIQNPKYKLPLLQNIERINEADSPFTEIEVFISEIADHDPLNEIKKEYWIEVGEYLTERRMDEYPFKKNAIGLLKG